MDESDGLNDLSNLEIIKERFKRDNFAGILGIVLDELTGDFVKMHMKLNKSLNNFFDRPHGGAIYGLADAAFSVIGNNSNNISVALECSINYHSSPEPGDILYVEGKLIAGSRRIGTYLFSLYTLSEDERKMVATMKSTLYRTGKPINKC
ncbi:MAG: PaaI family thioesterase [Promethearchaeota archaeon]